MIGALQGAALRRAYGAGTTPVAVAEAVLERIEDRGDDAVWIHRVPAEDVVRAAGALARRFPGPTRPPLFGLPFAVKDNIDVEGLPTTAACPAFAYLPERTAPAVQAALDAGAVLVGKTNLDQFASGLSGTRSPYGIVRNPFDPSIIAGGSSSGSAVAVAAGLVTFALGTDTAGSGRVPAGLTGTVGVKPSRGLVSTRGIVPACRSLDCASVFAGSVRDGAAVLAVMAGLDADDPFSRRLPQPPAHPPGLALRSLRVGVPAGMDTRADFDGDDVAQGAFDLAANRLRGAGARVVDVDISSMLEAGWLLYEGPWLAERVVGLGAFLAEHPDALHDVTRQVLAGAATVSGPDVFRGIHALASAARRARDVWEHVDVLMVPTVPTAPTVERMLADPIAANATLGRFTNFVNLLDYAALAMPSTTTPTGLPVGVTFLAPAGADALLLDVGVAWEALVGLPVGVRGEPLEPGVRGAPAPLDDSESVRLAVVGAHLEGQPLHADLLRLGAGLSARTRTAPTYRLFALPGAPTDPARPGLLRVAAGGGAVEAEVYRLPVTALGRLVAGIPAPLGIGTVELDDGARVLGFVCEQAGTVGATDITEHGGWRQYLARGHDT